MPRLNWSRQAIDDLTAIRRHIAEFDPAAANRIAHRILGQSKRLADFPHIGREVHPGIRQLSSVWPYLIRYRVGAEMVEILSVRHGARAEIQRGEV